MLSKVYITTDEIKRAAISLVKYIREDNYSPDLIISVVRGGLIPAGYVSYYLDNKRVSVLSLHLYEGEEQVYKNLEEQEYQLKADIQNIIKRWDPKNILIVDDLIDTAHTLRLIETNLLAVRNYFKMVGKKSDFKWRFGVLYSEKANKQRLDSKVYSGLEKPEGWLVFPWDTEE